jgi:RNA-binding protein Musashi
VTGEDLRKAFAVFGTVLDATVQCDRVTNKSRGFGFVTFSDEKAVDACAGTREVVFAGRRAEVKKAQTRDKMRGAPLRFITSLFANATV